MTSPATTSALASQHTGPIESDSGDVADSAVRSTPEPRERFVRVAYDDPLGAPLLDDLGHEYDERYGDVHKQPARTEILRYPPEAFAAPTGAFILLLDGEEPISGGAFMRCDESTAEFKRIWTHAEHRGRGLAGRVLAELEAEARRLGYTQVYLTTGPRQPEAVRLYLKNGYAPLYDPALEPEEIGMHGFTKDLDRSDRQRP